MLHDEIRRIKEEMLERIEDQSRNNKRIILFVSAIIVFSILLITDTGLQTSFFSGLLLTAFYKFFSYNFFSGALLAVTLFFFTYALYNFKIYNYDRKPSEQEKRANTLAKKENISWEAAMERVKEEEKINIKQKKESEILEGFLKVLDYLRGTSRFYKMFISLFISLSLLCVLGIIYLSQSSGVYHDIIFENKTVGQIIAEGFFKNIRFFIYESLIITLLGYCLKKISNYISMIEIYKELEILLIMDVQRQDKFVDEREKGIVSEDFQKKFSEILTKHYDSFIKNKAELKLKTACEMLKSFKEKQSEK